jgi:AcrR family transcriptional regulator
MSQDSSRTGSKSLVQSRHGKLWRQDDILAAAFQEFAAKGYAEARLEDVAKRAGIAKGTIYLYFKNKELLFRAVLRGLTQHVFEELETFVQMFSGSAEELIHCVLSRQYTEIVGNPKARAMFRLLIAESHKFPELSSIYLREVITPGVSALGALVRKGVASGEFHETRIADFPQVLVGPAVLAVVWTLILGERYKLDLDAYKEAHLELLLYGLRKTAVSTTPDSQHAIDEREQQ